MSGFKQVSLALATAGLLASGAAQAKLLDRGGGLIYDDVLNITWLSDANYAKTSGYDDPNGLESWLVAKDWAANLSFHDSVRNVDYSDWRLPTAGPLCSGFRCIASEMGHLFYTDGGLNPGQSITESAVLNNYFTNMQLGRYWFDTVYELPLPVNVAWSFKTDDGTQELKWQGFKYYAWAVRPGDVAAPVPEPETYAMMLAGLGLLGVMARRKEQKLNA